MQSRHVIAIGAGMLAVCLWGAPVDAQTLSVCAGPQGQLRMIGPGGSCRPSESGPFTLQMGGGVEPTGPVNFAWSFSEPTSAAMPAACTNQLIVEVTVPADAGDGMLIVQGRHRVQIAHLFTVLDAGYLVWSNSPATCGADDSERSFFSLDGFDFATSADLTVFTQRAFPASGGNTVTMYLNSAMPQGANSPVNTVDAVGADYVIVEFHVNPPPPIP